MNDTIVFKMRSVTRVAPIRAWHEQAPCGTPENTKLNWFPEDWESYPDMQVAYVCVKCPFRVQCLDDALVYDETDGVRGGTTPYQRRQLRNKYTRARCPCCLSNSIFSDQINEICVSCGTSWIATPSPKL